ncbi:zinc-binding dehydrogenase [Luteolibacter sp. SL250]|uniref:zinc-binding dehydrogenase n=1 Tax=Luteolibacter sp. SL250 TaxID=2995170 RepID=UPI002270E680|nr:zinc-binding dehydrogenase [Luteolibacter sp. SL250]WAC18731.1 zinc-binding dehydrogenase [Luteolibacter sp. SL250]
MMTSTERKTAAVQLFRGPSRPFAMAEVPLPETLAAGEVLVRITLATICGSDLHTVDGRRHGPVPCVLGHEAVGVVEASARGDIRPGQRVTWSLADSCGCCAPCTSWSLPQKCGSLFKYGHAPMDDGSGLNGCYASHILLRPGTTILTVPDSLADELVAPANCALATIAGALEELPSPCDAALVQGSGLLGLYACAWLRAKGVSTVYCADMEPRRLALVEEFGGIPVLAGEVESTVPKDIDLVVEVAGSSAAVPQGISVLRPGGMYVWAGMVHPETRLDLTGEAVVRKCLTVRGVHNYQPRHLAQALAFLEGTKDTLPYGKLVSPPLPLSALDEAFEMTRRREWLRVSVKP